MKLTYRHNEQFVFGIYYLGKRMSIKRGIRSFLKKKSSLLLKQVVIKLNFLPECCPNDPHSQIISEAQLQDSFPPKRRRIGTVDQYLSRLSSVWVRKVFCQYIQVDICY